MDTRINLTHSEALEALQTAVTEVQRVNKGQLGITVKDYAKREGIGVLTARERLRPLVESGAVEVVQVEITRMDGKKTLVSGYRVR